MTNTVSNPEAYFLEVPLYHPLDLTLKESKVGLVKIQFFMGTFDAYCVGCKQHSVFRSCQVLPTLTSHVDTKPARSVDELLRRGQALLPTKDAQPMLAAIQDVLEYVARPKYFQSRFICSRDASHHLFFETKVLADTFQKVGQYPALADLHLGDLQKYRKVLGDQYSELARGVGLFAHGVGIGAFIYLRRVFERLIADAHVVATADPQWDETIYEKSRMDERIKLLASHLPLYVVENRAVYQIMSKGVHELSETECLDYFPVVRVALELMLDEKLDSLTKEQKVASTRASLDRILETMKSKR